MLLMKLLAMDLEFGYKAVHVFSVQNGLKAVAGTAESSFKLNKKSPRGIGPRRFSLSPRATKYSTVTQDMSPSGVNFLKLVIYLTFDVLPATPPPPQRLHCTLPLVITGISSSMNTFPIPHSLALGLIPWH